jgi:hypothetical protein
MSVKVMSRVWEHAPHKESTLLVLLALADYADDNGICWPDVASVAKKARISDRRTTDIIHDLEADGSIAFQKGGGRGRRSCYAVLLGLSPEQRERVKEIHRNYFSENKTLKQGVKDETTSPIKKQKGELQRKERVNYSVNSDQVSEQQDAPNPIPIRHEIRHEDSVPVIHVGGDHSESASKSAPAPLFEKLAETCRIPMALATQKQRAELGKAAAKLNDIGATPEQLDRFLVWWESDSNWRSRKAREQQRKPEAPRPVEVLEEWGNATSAPTRRPANGPAPPVSARPPDAVPASEAMRRVLEARKANQS